MEPLVTVVVPVYNAERFLDNCIESILTQTYKNLEICIINDGSTDRSEIICKNWALRDNRIILVTQQNHGQGQARNFGCKLGHGEYVVFVDADDKIEQNYVRQLYDHAVRFDAEISVCGEKYCRKKRNTNAVIVMAGIDGAALMFEQTQFDTAPWGKLIKRHLVCQNPLPEDTLYEDLAGVYRWFLSAKRVVYFNKKLYSYNRNSDGVSQRLFDSRNFEQLHIIQKIFDELWDSYPTIRSAVVSRRFSICCKLVVETPKYTQYEKENEQILKILKADAFYVFTHAKRWKNKIAAAVFLLFGKKGLHYLGSITNRVKNRILYLKPDKGKRKIDI